MDRRALIVGWLVCVGTCPALAQGRATTTWRGAWQVEGQTCWRHLGGPNHALELEGRLDDLDVRLRGGGDGRGLTLVGVAERVSGEPAVWQQLPMRLDARPARDGTLEVTLEVGGDEPRRERWLRATAPRLSVSIIDNSSRPEPQVRGARRGAPRVAATPTEPDVTRFEPGAGDLVFEVVVEGRPMAVALQVLAAPDDARYAPLDGLVHHVDLADGATLPVGRHRVTWSGTDRSVAARPLLPGRYTVTVVSSDAPLGPPPGEDAAPQAALTLVVGDVALTAHEAPAAPADGGLASRLDARDARPSR